MKLAKSQEEVLKAIKLTVITASLLLAIPAVPALADEDVSEDEAKKIEAALNEWGCKGGKMEKEPESGVYEVDDTECAGGEYDAKLDSDLNVILITRH
jgi:hypothetical protein